MQAYLVLVGAGVGGEQRDDLVELAVGQELVQWGVQQADRHGQAVHRLEDALDVAAQAAFEDKQTSKPGFHSIVSRVVTRRSQAMEQLDESTASLSI